jgi:hypothetical protein
MAEKKIRFADANAERRYAEVDDLIQYEQDEERVKALEELRDSYKS